VKVETLGFRGLFLLSSALGIDSVRSGEADSAGVGKDGACEILGLGVLGVRSI
jgi:hypothetical protein